MAKGGQGHGDSDANPPVSRTVWALAALFFTNGLIYASYIPRLPEIRDQAGVSLAVLGVALTASSVAGLVGSVFAGRAIPRFGSRTVILVGGALYAVALPGVGLSRSGHVLILALLLLGVFDVFVDIAANLQASVVSALRERPVISRLHGAWSLGSFAGAGTAVLATRLGVPVATHYIAVAVLVVVVLVAVYPGLRVTDGAHPLQDNSPHSSGRGPSWLWLGRGALLLGGANALIVAVDTSMGEWSSLRMTDDLSAVAATGAAAFLVYTAGLTLGRMTGDAVVHRIGRRKTATASLVVALIGLLVATLTDSVAVTFGGILLTGIGASVLAPQLADAAARAPGQPGAGFAVLFAGQRAATVVTPVLIGFLATATDLGVGGAIAVVAVPCVLLLALLIRPVLRDS